MHTFDSSLLKLLYTPPSNSHKGRNGKLLLIGGSHLFHAASLWALTVASRIVDMVFYASVPENNQIVLEAKREFRNGIVIPRERIDDYAEEADCILIGPGLMRSTKVVSHQSSVGNNKKIYSLRPTTANLQAINNLPDEGEQTYWLTKYLLEIYPHKKWVIDGGSLQMMDPEWLLQLNGNVIITPHQREFSMLFSSVMLNEVKHLSSTNKRSFADAQDDVKEMARKYNCIILLKGQEDIVCSPKECIKIAGGNAGMTKGGTGDVLAGLVAAVACKNDLFLSACAGSYINKKAGESLYKRVGYYFNASDLANEIPEVMKKLF